ncbi:MAG: hypothetical protein UU48_C0004G0066 [Candidatus Uhrbacteria bacterium GW2011_GWF2_41_16]|uniref:Uncharacterized protein n=1 Tax=Candidatus Uhrbacteria bacterium GW2011_GWF2_41_16 TaxID=1618997 RepID=A0A0G0VBH6_9BACT|nr:MAG: hypothetical protein UU48_C0004G0066 [Candidatus Uhrbacteria bacterium GW2011_GWF2_41_16]
MNEEIRTRPVYASDVRRGLRVKVIDPRSRYLNQLGTVIGVSEGCGCRDGWGKVLLDGDAKIREEFRIGYQRNSPDLVEVTSESNPPPKLIFLTRHDIRVDMKVRIWEGDERYGHEARRGQAVVKEIDYSYLYLKFDDGHVDWYSTDYVAILASSSAG